MSMHNSKAYLERLNNVLNAFDSKLSDIRTTYANRGFVTVAENGFNRTNVMKDLSTKKLVLPTEEEIPSLGTVNGYTAVESFPLKGYTKNGVMYVDPTNPEEVYTDTISNTVVTDRADGNADINRWVSRNIFKFKPDHFGYARCHYAIPFSDLANGIVIDGGETAPHENTLANYPYPEEIIMIAQNSEKNFIHFINVQYTDSHYGHYNERNYNFMIVKDRTRYGILDESGNKFRTYTSVYANNVETELAYILDGKLYIPVPDEAYGEEMLNTLWDCRVIWRNDAPDRNVTVEFKTERNENIDVADFDISNDRIHLINSTSELVNKNRNSITGFGDKEIPKNVVHSSFVMTDTGSILVAPEFNESLSVLEMPQNQKLVTPPNQFFDIGKGKYIGFHYYNPTNRGTVSYIDDFDNRTSQLYFNLFNSTLGLISPIESYDNYPCNKFNSEFVQQGKILKVFAENINKATGVSTYIVFTKTGMYRFTFTVFGNTLTNNSIETLLTYDISPYSVDRYSRTDYSLYSASGFSTVVSDESGNYTLSNLYSSANLLSGRAFAFIVNGENSTFVSYNNIHKVTAVTDTIKSIDLTASGNVIKGRYGYFNTTDNNKLLCKMVEHFTFDKELDSIE